MFIDGANGVRPIGDGLLEVSDASLNNLIASGDIDDIYDVEQTPFARGKFATVRRAMHKKTGVNFAAKFLRRRRRAQCTLKEIRHEIAILLLCAESQHIVKLFSVHETNVETALFLEMANGGELQTLLDENGSLSERETIICMKEVLKALQFLHKKSIAHLDLKPQNILLCGKRVEDGLKLCDFGISRIVEETSSKVREILGTPDYVAPEVLSYEPLSLRTDIWSVGVLAYVLLSGFSPFGGDTKQETFLNISQCNLNFPDDLFENVTEIAKDFIKSALQVTAEDRMSADECLEHKWLIETNQSLKMPLENGTTTVKETTIQQNGDHESNKSNGIDYAPESSPSKPSTGFFLHQQNPNKSRTFLKQNHTSNSPNINCNNLSPIVGPPNNANDLLRDFATNKENINLSKILANRMTPIQNQSSTQLLNNLNKGSTTSTTITATPQSSSAQMQLINNMSDDITGVQQTKTSNIMLSSSSSSSMASGPLTPQTQSKLETILFPDAPTTPKVSRKSAIESGTDTPSCVALVKQFQLSNGNLSTAQKTLTPTTATIATTGKTTTNRIDFDEINISEPVYTQSKTTQRSKLTTYKDLAQDNTIPTTYRLSATAITASTTNGHHSITSSTLSINTLTDTSVGVQSDSTVTINCLCGVDKAGNCCCNNSSSRQALNYRKKSLAVVDNSILC